MNKYSKFPALLMLVFSLHVNAQGNLSIEKNALLNINANEIWQLIGQYNGLPEWHPLIIQSELEGSGSDYGDLRILTLNDGGVVIEKLLSYDNQTMQYSYEIIDSLLPVENYQATIKIEAVQEWAKFSWSSSFSAKGTSHVEAIELIKGVYQAGIDNLIKRYGQPEP